MKMRKKKIAIVGAGNAGCITAMNYHYNAGDNCDSIDIYYDPNAPIERVGQGGTLSISTLIERVLNIDWHYNPIKSTFKSGIMYEGWGKKNYNIFHPFPFSSMACHYVPNLFSQEVLKCKHFNVIEKSVENPEEEIDADFIFDCRGRSKNNPEDYDQLINPLNAVILSRKEGPDPSLIYTRSVATPDGWTFVIPNSDSVSYGYLYNNKITSKEKATENFTSMFDVVPDGDLTFNNYIAKSAFVGERTILNGNRLSFLEPLEATSTAFYCYVAENSFDYIFGGVDKKIINKNIRNEMKQIETFILWHYQNGSKYDTEFWRYAKSLPFEPDPEFNQLILESKKSYEELNKETEEIQFSQWSAFSFKSWNENI
jgi:tryptophan halogenase